MKRILPAVLFAITCLLSCTAAPDKGDNTTATTTSSNTPTATPLKFEPGSPEEFASVIAQFVIDSNYAGIDSLIIRHDEMKTVVSNSTVTDQGKEAAISHIDTEIGKMKNDMINGLKDIRAKGELNNIVWMAAKFKESKYTIAEPTGYQMMQLTCIIDFNGVEYPFTVTDVVKTPDGWKLGGKMFYGKQ